MYKIISIFALLTACGGSEEGTETTGTTTATTTTTPTGTTTSTTTTTTTTTVTVSGEGDSYSDAACENYGIADVDIQLASDSNDAATVVFVPYNDTNRAMITMPASGDGYMVIEVADWMSYLRLFTDAEVEYSVVGGEDYGRDENLSCPASGMTDQLMAFHEWDFYTVKFDASSPSQFWFQADKQQ